MGKMKVILIIVLVIGLCIPVSAAEQCNSPKVLSELTEEECVEFILSKGVCIPDELSDYKSLGTFVKNVISTVEKDPNHMFVINYSVTYRLANEIKEVVNEYYGIDSSSDTISRSTRSLYSLQYSTPYGNWKNEYLEYNCYGYAIDQKGAIDGIYIAFEPGDFDPESPSFSLNMSVSQMAELTVSDLENLGNQCCGYGADYSKFAALSSTHKVICIRKCNTAGLEDFHFMRLYGSSWRHKPGNTQVLTLNSRPNQSTWFNEVSFNNVEYSGDRYYNSAIYYIAYGNNHKYTASFGGEDYHSGNQHYYLVLNTCVVCGDTYYTWDVLPCSGPPCIDYSPYAHDDFELVKE